MRALENAVANAAAPSRPENSARHRRRSLRCRVAKWRALRASHSLLDTSHWALIRSRGPRCASRAVGCQIDTCSAKNARISLRTNGRAPARSIHFRPRFATANSTASPTRSCGRQIAADLPRPESWRAMAYLRATKSAEIGASRSAHAKMVAAERLGAGSVDSNPYGQGVPGQNEEQEVIVFAE